MPPPSEGRPRAVVLHERYPHTLSNPVARPSLLLAQRGFDVHIVDTWHEWPNREYPGCRLWAEASRTAALRRVLELRPDVLFMEGGSWILPLAFRFPRSWVRCTGIPTRRSRRIAQHLLLKRPRLVGVQNPYDGARLHIPPRQRLDLPAPVDLTFWSTPVARDPKFWTSRGIGPPEHVIMLTANLVALKRPAEIVAAAAPILLERKGLVVAFAGATVEAEVEEDIRQIAARHGVAERTLLLGQLAPEEVRQVLAWGAIHVVNSERESQCMALYESLAAGVPNCIRDIPWLTMAFPDLPKHDSVETLRANLIRLLDDENYAREAVARSQQPLQWADTKAHDRTFEEGLARLGQA